MSKHTPFRLVAPWPDYTDVCGGVSFVDSLSEPVDSFTAERLAAAIGATIIPAHQTGIAKAVEVIEQANEPAPVVVVDVAEVMDIDDTAPVVASEADEPAPTSDDTAEQKQPPSRRAKRAAK